MLVSKVLMMKKKKKKSLKNVNDENKIKNVSFKSVNLTVSEQW